MAFRQALPHAQLSLTEGFSVLMVESLRAGRLDMAVLYNPAPSPDLEMSLLHEDTLVLIAGKKSKPIAGNTPLKNVVQLADLAKLPLIAPSRPNAFRLLIDTEMLRLNCKPNIVLEIDGLNAILELVKEGMGYAVLPAYTLSNFAKPEDFTTHRVEKPKLMSQLMLVWSARRPMTATHKAAMQLTQDVVSQALQANS
jgi:LysR family nitrogen assimilation transcriptional regulator